MRSIISVAAIAIEVVMILSVVAIFMGQLDGQRMRTNGIGADMMVRPPNSSNINAMGGAPVPARNADVLRKLPHVLVVAPVIQQFALTSSPEIIYGIDFKSYDALKPFVFLSGGPFTGPDDAIIDDVFAKKDKGYHVGDVIQIQSHAFRICGIVEAGKGGRKMVPIETLGELMGSSGKASLFYIKTDSEANQGLVRQEILAVPGMSQYIVQTMHEWLSLMTPDHIPGFNIALNVVTVIATLVGFLVIFLSMYTAVLERTREIGILKAVGGGSGLVLDLLFRETLLLALMGTAVGIALTYGTQWLMRHLVPPPLVQETVYWWWLYAGGIAIVGSMLGVVVPGVKAVKQDVTEALSYE